MKTYFNIRENIPRHILEIKDLEKYVFSASASEEDPTSLVFIFECKEGRPPRYTYFEKVSGNIYKPQGDIIKWRIWSSSSVSGTRDWRIVGLRDLSLSSKNFILYKIKELEARFNKRKLHATSR